MSLLAIEFCSEWDEGVVTTPALLDLDTGLITVTEVVEDCEEFEHLQRQVAVIGDQRIEIDDERWDEENVAYLTADSLQRVRASIG